jgi:hypothetical protein
VSGGTDRDDRALVSEQRRWVVDSPIDVSDEAVVVDYDEETSPVGQGVRADLLGGRQRVTHPLPGFAAPRS